MDISRSIGLSEAISGLKTQYPVVSLDPLIFALDPAERQFLLVTRYGVVVVSNWSKELEKKVLTSLSPFLDLPHRKIEDFDEIKVSLDGRLEVLFDEVIISKFDEKHMTVIGTLMSQSVGLDSYEKKIEHLLEELNKQIKKLEKSKLFLSVSPFVKNIVGIMHFEREMIASVGIFDKPELAWNNKDLDTLYHQLAENLEIPDRTEILRTKIEVLRNNSRAVLDILDARKANFLEWIIIVLIAVEIFITLAEKLL